jgi:DinB superfamily
MQAISTFFPTQVTSLDEALEQYAQVRRTLLHELATEKYSAPPEGKWSVEDILWHLHLVERGSGSAIRRMLEGERGEKIVDADLKALWEKMFTFVLNRAELKLPAPPNVSPQGNTPPREECIIALQQSQDKVLSHLQGVSTDDLLRVYFPHPIIGTLPALYWVMFIAMHEARHLEQLRELITQ